jgi:hypothetical protein
MALSGGPLALPLASGTPDKCLQNNPDIAYNLSCSVWLLIINIGKRR